MAQLEKKPKKYLNNKDMLEEVKLSRDNDQMSDKLARMFTMLTKNYSRKSNFCGYTFVDDMQGYALLQLVRTWAAFNPEKSDNPFAFYTQCIKNSFIQYIKSEKKQRELRDEILISVGLLPSSTYMNEYEIAMKEGKVEEIVIED